MRRPIAPVTVEELIRAQEDNREDVPGQPLAEAVIKSGGARTVVELASHAVKQDGLTPEAVMKIAIACYVSGIAIGMCVVENRETKPC